MSLWKIDEEVKEGIKQGQKENKSTLKIGLNIKTISKATSLSEEKIESMK